MFKLTTVFLFAVMFTTGTMHGQTLSKPPQIGQTGADLQKVFKQETQKIKSESAVVDAKMMEKSRRQVSQNNWSKRDKIVIGVIVASLVVLAVVLALTTKRCIRRDPSGCDFNNDINCRCVEYDED